MAAPFRSFPTLEELKQKLAKIGIRWVDQTNPG